MWVWLRVRHGWGWSWWDARGDGAGVCVQSGCKAAGGGFSQTAERLGHILQQARELGCRSLCSRARGMQGLDSVPVETWTWYPPRAVVVGNPIFLYAEPSASASARLF